MADVNIDEKELRSPSDSSSSSTSASPLSTHHAQPILSVDEKEKILRKAYRTVDVRLLLFYLVIFSGVRISQKNITNAKILNVEQGTNIMSQLHLAGWQWAWILSASSYPYIALETFATLLLKRFDPNVWVSRIIITWSIISMCQAATKSYAGLLTCRVLLGVTEAGLFPSFLYHLSFWLPTSRMPFRIALLSAFGQLSGMFSGVLAFGISHLNEKGGLPGWRWLFLLEGLPLFLLGVAVYFFLPNYPQTATILDEQQRHVVLAEIPETQPSAEAKTWDWPQARAFLHDPLSYLFILIWGCHSIGAFSIMTALPSVIFNLGLTGSATTQLLTMHVTHALGESLFGSLTTS